MILLRKFNLKYRISYYKLPGKTVPKIKLTFDICFYFILFLEKGREREREREEGEEQREKEGI